MTRIDLPFVRIVNPPRGGVYYYFDTGKRNAKGKRVYVRLPDPSHPSFGGSYASLLGHRNRRAKLADTEALTLPRLVAMFEKSPQFRKFAENTKIYYSRHLAMALEYKAFRHAPVNLLYRRDIIELMDDHADRPGAANAMLKSIRALYHWAKQREHVTANPALEIEEFASTPHEPWPAHVLDAAFASDDAQIRLVVALLYYTAQRVGDIINARWSDIDGRTLTIKQQKTGKPLQIPMHRDLLAILATAPRRQLTIVTNRYGTGPTTRQAVNKMLSAFGRSHGAHVVTHGLRKNAVIALLEMECSVAEVSSMSGQSLQLVEHYARARNQTALATAAVLKWERVK